MSYSRSRRAISPRLGEPCLRSLGRKNASWPVSRVLWGPHRCGRGGHSSGVAVAGGLDATNPDGSAETRSGASEDRRGHPYSVLLRMGLAMLLPLPVARCALTAPFHPCPGMPGRFAFCGAIPGVAPAGRYPASCFRGARTFLHSPGREQRPPSQLARLMWPRRAAASTGRMTAPNKKAGPKARRVVLGRGNGSRTVRRG